MEIQLVTTVLTYQAGIKEPKYPKPSSKSVNTVANYNKLQETFLAKSKWHVIYTSNIMNYLPSGIPLFKVYAIKGPLFTTKSQYHNKNKADINRLTNLKISHK